ncbi:MAG: signal transduction histidine kinase [Flavobacteriales bacterium]|jgi:signal transduction histidine kinase
MSKKLVIILFLLSMLLHAKAQQYPFLLGFSMPEVEKMFIQKQFFNSPVLPDSLDVCQQEALLHDFELLFGESVKTLIEIPTHNQACDRPFDLWINQINTLSLDSNSLTLAKNLLLDNATLHASYKVIGLIALGHKLIKTNLFAQALLLLQEGIALAESCQNDVSKNLAYLSLIELYNQQIDTKNELKHIMLSEESARRLSSRYMMAKTLQRKSILQMSYKKPSLDSALTADLKALETYELLGLPENIAGVYNSLGSIYEEKKEYTKSITYYNKALKNRESSHDSIGMSYLYNNIGTLYQAQEKHAQALSYFQQGTDILESIDSSNSNLYVCYYNLAETYEALEQYEKALTYFKKFDLLEYERMNKDQLKEIAQLQEKYDAKEREKEIKELGLFAELQQLNIDKTTAQRNWVIGLIVFGFLFAISIMRSMKLAKQKEVLKLEQGIFEKNQKLTLLTLKNENETTKALSVGQDSERKRIAIYLHDHFGNSMGALKMHAENIAKTHELSTDKIQEIRVLINLIEATNKELRELSHELTDTSNSSFKLSENIERMCHSFNVSDTLSVVFKANGENLLSTHVSLEFYRICQEALTNALKYSKASSIAVNLTEDKKGVILSITDNGIGMDLSDTSTNSGNGFTNMSNRARSVHAEFNVTTAPNEGTTIMVHLPFQKT